MSFRIDSGLFKFDFTDHHAVLGVPVGADLKSIRKRYLQIARLLHPDSCCAQNQVEKDWANELLTKLVNPAYEKFSQQRHFEEYIVLLTQMGKRLSVESAKIELKYHLSKQLMQTNNLEHQYQTALHQLAEKQYTTLDNVLQLIAQISELNLVYLLRQGSTEMSPLQTAPYQQISTTPVASNPTDNKTEKISPTRPESFVTQYLERARNFITESNLTQAVLELQEALKLEPSNSTCHSLLGVVYFKQNRMTMAKVHFERALKLNPKDETALAGQKSVEQANTSSKMHQQQSGGGIFGALFGRKK